ncbi:MAG: TIM barrel protein, partial [Chloroflexota bacterium]
VRSLCRMHNISVSGLGSPLGKVAIDSPMEHEIAKLNRLVEICGVLDVNAIRIFAYYPTGKPDEALSQSVERIQQLVDTAEANDIILMLENDENLVADIPSRCLHILQTINNPHLRLAWDAANFITSGVANPVTGHFAQLKDYIGVIHIKDGRAKDGSRRAAGEGDAEVSLLLQKLAEDGYSGYLAVEPHPFFVEGKGELHGKAGMAYAVEALRNLLDKAKLQERNALS